jgi:hypothetical protein
MMTLLLEFFWSYCALIDIIESFINGAVPKFTLNRLHQIVTARYFARSTPAGSS